ncbi:hypothetical protein [Glycomyces sp. MUSA5-2]|uniref:hypothetical protein n=1 Tax=Glycomyces sp. MUSA5-2 TaxID=2053002 RepID=UPI00300A5F47
MSTIVFVAPISLWRRALATETRAAADAGHRVRLIAEEHPDWHLTPLDERVEVVWTNATSVYAKESPLAELLYVRLPLGLLRRAARGPLRRRARKAARRWRRKVVEPRARLRGPRGKALREAYRVRFLKAALADADYDWIVFHEPQAVELTAEWLPAFLEARPRIATSFSFEPQAEEAGSDA